jgi:hypothetical protein
MKKTEKLQQVYSLCSMDQNDSYALKTPGSKGHIVGSGGNARMESNDWISIEFEGGGSIEIRVSGGKGHIVGTGGNARNEQSRGGKGYVIGSGGNGRNELSRGGKGHVVGNSGNG